MLVSYCVIMTDWVYCVSHCYNCMGPNLVKMQPLKWTHLFFLASFKFDYLDFNRFCRLKHSVVSAQIHNLDSLWTLWPRESTKTGSNHAPGDYSLVRWHCTTSDIHPNVDILVLVFHRATRDECLSRAHRQIFHLVSLGIQTSNL